MSERERKGCSFGWAIRVIKGGRYVYREGWNGKGMRVFMASSVGTSHAHLVLIKSDGTKQPGWVASQEDILAEDWFCTDETVSTCDVPQFSLPLPAALSPAEASAIEEALAEYRISCVRQGANGTMNLYKLIDSSSGADHLIAMDYVRFPEEVPEGFDPIKPWAMGVVRRKLISDGVIKVRDVTAKPPALPSPEDGDIGVRELQTEIGQWAIDKGWHDGDIPTDASWFAEKFLMMVTEIAEATEAVRNGEDHVHISDGKPEGSAVEVADMIIRGLQWFAAMEIDAADIIRMKMAYNQKRPYRHGGKVL